MSGFVSVSRYTIKMTISEQDILQTVMNNKTNCKSRITRRRFIGAAASMTAFMIVSRHVLGGPGHISPGENLKITNNPQADRYIRRDIYRKGWTL